MCSEAPAGVDGIGGTVAGCQPEVPLLILLSWATGLDLGDWKCSPLTHQTEGRVGMSTYVCFADRYRPVYREYSYSSQVVCPKCGKEMVYVHSYLPASRDDHKMWQLAERKHYEPISGMRRRGRGRRPRYSVAQRKAGMADWERELLKSAKK